MYSITKELTKLIEEKKISKLKQGRLKTKSGAFLNMFCNQNQKTNRAFKRRYCSKHVYLLYHTLCYQSILMAFLPLGMV